MNRGKSRRSCRGDYDFRHGLTQNPITSFSVKTFPILHALLRGLDYCLKLVWKENKQNSVMIKAARKRIQEIIKAKTGLSVDKPDPVGAGGTTTATGTWPGNYYLIHRSVKFWLTVFPRRSKVMEGVIGRCSMCLLQTFLNTEGSIFQEESQYRKFGTALQRNILNFGKPLAKLQIHTINIPSASTFCCTYSSKWVDKTSLLVWRTIGKQQQEHSKLQRASLSEKH